MPRRASLPAILLLVAAAASLVTVVSPAPSFRAFRPLPASFNRPAAVKSFKQLAKHATDILDIIQKLVPPPAPPGGGGGGGGDQLYSTPAETVSLYTIDVVVGTPEGQNISGVIDISSELMWTQCSPCTRCLSPPVSSFNPSDSTTRITCGSRMCQKIFQSSETCFDGNTSEPCGYTMSYSQNTSASGFFVSDNFTIAGTSVGGMVFGCSVSSAGDFSGASGVIGLGRGELSLVSQLGLSNFSYYLAPEDAAADRGNEVQLGVAAVPQTGRVRVRSTPLLRSRNHTELYYVGLTGIRVDGRDLAGIPPGTFDLAGDGSGGVFLSTTVPVTYLVEDAYEALKQALGSSIPVQRASQGGGGLCYTAQSMAGVKIPRLTLVFAGDDATMELKRQENYFFRFNDGGRDLVCLSVLPSRDACSWAP
ncbi:hypothetical protein ACP4OV_013651 [Aristida adscensionis]